MMNHVAVLRDVRTEFTWGENGSTCAVEISKIWKKKSYRTGPPDSVLPTEAPPSAPPPPPPPSC